MAQVLNSAVCIVLACGSSVWAALSSASGTWTSARTRFKASFEMFSNDPIEIFNLESDCFSPHCQRKRERAAACAQEMPTWSSKHNVGRTLRNATTVRRKALVERWEDAESLPEALNGSRRVCREDQKEKFIDWKVGHALLFGFRSWHQ